MKIKDLQSGWVTWFPSFWEQQQNVTHFVYKFSQAGTVSKKSQIFSLWPQTCIAFSETMFLLSITGKTSNFVTANLWFSNNFRLAIKIANQMFNELCERANLCELAGASNYDVLLNVYGILQMPGNYFANQLIFRSLSFGLHHN